MNKFIEKFSLKGKKALITGGSRGIGSAISKVLADAGADIIITGRDQKGLDSTQKSIKEAGGECLTIKADLSIEQEAREVGMKAIECYETIDILVNNAGITLLDDILNTSENDWEKVQSVNLKAPFIIAKTLVPKMIKQRNGKVINISSLASEYALENHVAYSVSKSGINMLTKSMACEWSRFNIQVNAVCPTVILTDMAELAWGDPKKRDPMLAKIPIGRFGQPHEVADLVLFLSSSASGFICGQSIFIDGGYSIM